MLVATFLPNPWTVRVDTARTGAAGIPDPVAGATFAAQVPGCVHSDLLAAGAIPDPYLDRNEDEVAWVGRADWHYETVLPVAGGSHERTDLVFEGLDTFAEVTVAGHVLGRTGNMHRGYRFDVTGPTASGAPAGLSVGFTSAYVAAEALREELGARPNAYPEPFNFVRKMACGFGWDWGPTLVTAGIWRPVRLERWSTARLASVRPHVTVRRADGQVRVAVDLERTAAGAVRPLLVRVSIAGQETAVPVAALEAEAVVELSVPRPRLWWPHTLGEQDRYELRVGLEDAESGAVLDRWSRRVGFRTIELDSAPDESGSAFTLMVNGVAVFARGVNWIPDDCFPSRVTAARYAAARIAGRRRPTSTCCGSGAAGSTRATTSTTSCDERGLLVWQDFLFACAAYPEEEPLARGGGGRGARERRPARCRTRASCCGTATTRTSGAARTGAGRS